MAAEPDALFITNGPGDPRKAVDAIRCVRETAGGAGHRHLHGHPGDPGLGGET